MTEFTFPKYKFVEGGLDVGNFNYGYTGRYVGGEGYSPTTLWIAGGVLQTGKDLLKPSQWGKAFSELNSLMPATRAPFGDEMDDFIWTTTGMNYADTEKIIIRNTLILTGIVLGIWYCNQKMWHNKKRHVYTHRLSNSIFEKKFEPFQGGVLMTSNYTYYLTDSTTFRKLVGDCDEKEFVRCNVQGDNVKIIKYSRRIHYGKETPIDSTFYSIKVLKEEGDFD